MCDMVNIFRMLHVRYFVSLWMMASACPVLAAERVLDASVHHLRAGGSGREWAEFAAEAGGPELVIRFESSANSGEQTLWVRQQDVRQRWTLLLNDKPLAQLAEDEADLSLAWVVPAGRLIDGSNTLRITSAARSSDDVMIGPIRLDPRPVREVLRDCTVRVRVTESHDRNPVPCRITIADENGSRVSLGALSDDHLAVRPGVIYTTDGRAEFGLAAGRYALYAGRGFEYSIDHQPVDIQRGDRAEVSLMIHREVPTPGLVSCDPHIHSRTHSGHGDASLTERLITIAGEGIELPIATEHNLHADYAPEAQRLELRRFLTPVVGNEVTTHIGHFNIFPVARGAAVPDFTLNSWPSLLRVLRATPDVQVVILNHPRDLHSGFRPFDPERYASLGRDDWPVNFNAVEVMNSGAPKNDPMVLFHDWMGLVSRGHRLAPIGSSDSHDVSRYTVGQGRTYVVCDDTYSPRIDVDAACRAIAEGRTYVSMGLLTQITVNGRYGPGDLVPLSHDLQVTVRVLGPSWVTAEEVELYADSELIRRAEIEPTSAVVKFEQTWTIPRRQVKSVLAAVATGPGVTAPYWPMAKPYQATAPEWRPYVFGSTGAVLVQGMP